MTITLVHLDHGCLIEIGIGTVAVRQAISVEHLFDSELVSAGERYGNRVAGSARERKRFFGAFMMCHSRIGGRWWVSV